ncbi:MAG: hypothetical protein M1818_001588 [Claussenomyces sp. TS43310]|nr:MAG: hypothetical protein M1818_001588 [Claussenomyces sp. TS43310]
MSTIVWPPIAPDELKKEEEASLARELAWLLDSLQETLASLKSGLEDCYALLAPIEPGSTLVVSSVRSETIKGHITRVGTRVVKGSLNLHLRTHPPLSLTLDHDHPILLQPLISLRNLLNQSLDCVDIARWTGDKHSAQFISSQLRLLHTIIAEANSLLRGPAPPVADETWTHDPLDPASFDPPLPSSLSFDLSIQDASIVLVVRALEPADAVPDLKSRLAFAIGAQRRLEHDEQDKDFSYLGQTVKVREKVRVDSADPSLMAAMAKLGALEHSVAMARKSLSIVMREDVEDD